MDNCFLEFGTAHKCNNEFADLMRETTQLMEMEKVGGRCFEKLERTLLHDVSVDYYTHVNSSLKHI